MTILRENLVIMNNKEERLHNFTLRMQGQQSFDASGNVQNIGIEKRVSPTTTRKIMNRKRDRTSVIFDWLTDPSNQFMFQDCSNEGHVFRSNSTVEYRPSNLFRGALYHSVRAWNEKYKNDFINNNNCYVLSKEKPKEFTEQNLILVKKEKQPSIKPYSNEQIKTKDSIEFDNIRDNDSDVFISDDQHCQNLSTEFNKISLENNCTMNKFSDVVSVDTSFSFPNYSRSKRQGKLRRINSDALFYKDVVRNNERRHSCPKRKRNIISMKLRSQVDNKEDLLLASSTHKLLEGTGGFEDDANLKLLEDGIKEIILREDLSLIKELEEFGFDFNAKDSRGNCALHYAAMQGNEEIIKEILNNGGSVWIRNDENQLPMELASNINVRMLLSRVTLFYREQYSSQSESCLVSKGMSFEL